MDNSALASLLTKLLERADITIRIAPAHSKADNTTQTKTTPTHDTATSWSLLEKAGITGSETLADLASHYTPDRIQKCIDGIKRSRSTVKSPPGYLVQALRRGYYQHKRSAE